MTDFAVLSMSDLLVPWEIIVKRVEAAAQGDFVIVIYNPSSKKRIHQLQDTRKILLKYRKPSTPVAIIKGAFRETQSVVLTDLENLENYADKLGMISTVIVGNSSTYNYKDLMINPRGYKSKYNIQNYICAPKRYLLVYCRIDPGKNVRGLGSRSHERFAR